MPKNPRTSRIYASRAFKKLIVFIVNKIEGMGVKAIFVYLLFLRGDLVSSYPDQTELMPTLSTLSEATSSLPGNATTPLPPECAESSCIIATVVSFFLGPLLVPLTMCCLGFLVCGCIGIVAGSCASTSGFELASGPARLCQSMGMGGNVPATILCFCVCGALAATAMWFLCDSICRMRLM
jgi:hypothetical protein